MSNHLHDSGEYDARQVPMPWAPPAPEAAAEAEAAGVEGHWRVTDALSCDWALSRIAEADKEAAEVDAQVAAEVARLKARIAEAEARGDELKRGPLRTRRFFEGHIRAWAEAERVKLLVGGRRKSRAFLHGRVGWQKGRASFRVTDEAALLAHCKEHHPELLVSSVDVAYLRKVALSTGEELPGTEVTVGEDCFYVDTKGAP